MGGGGMPQETNAQKQNRLRAEAENTRSIQEAVADRTNSYNRRTRPRQSILTGAVRSAIV